MTTGESSPVRDTHLTTRVFAADQSWLTALLRAIVVAFVLFICTSGVVMGEIEEPRWALVEQLDEVEIRHYDARVQAVTRMDESTSDNSAFRRLAGYIFGGNATEQKIAMTAPVETTLDTDDPVMTFNMPAEFGLTELPIPDSDDVTLEAVPAVTVAVLRFSGRATDRKVAQMTETLMGTLQEHGIKVYGSPSLNRYNPPWTLPFLRRNEVVVAVEAKTTWL